VTIQVENLTEKQLRLGVLKVALALTFGLLLAALLLSLLFEGDRPLARIPINALLLAVAISILTNGFLTLLKIVDWFENRRSKKAKN